MTSSKTETPTQDTLDRLPVIGSWLADGLDAWLGIADALNLCGLRAVLLADPDDQASPRITHADRSSPSSTPGQRVDARQAAPSSSLSDRAA